jgi:hypothetical protein
MYQSVKDWTMKTSERQLKEIKMKRSRFWLLGTLGVAAVLACALLVAGCGHDAASPLGPGSNDGGSGFGSVKDNGNGPLACPGGIAPVLVGRDADSAIIGVAGGRIDLTLGPYKSTFVVSAGGLVRPVLIAVDAVEYAGPSGGVAYFDFHPDGLAFRLPARLTLQCSDSDGTMKHLYWLNPQSGKWQVVNVAPVRGGEVQFNVAHFSKYGIS